MLEKKGRAAGSPDDLPGGIGSPLDPYTVSRDMRELQSPEIPPSLLSLFRTTVQELVAQGGTQNLLAKLHSAAHHGMLVFPVQHALVDILNKQGDAEITFLFEVSNFGLS